MLFTPHLQLPPVKPKLLETQVCTPGNCAHDAAVTLSTFGCRNSNKCDGSEDYRSHPHTEWV